MSDDPTQADALRQRIEQLERLLARERAARREAEDIGEDATRRLYEALRRNEADLADADRSRAAVRDLALARQKAITRMARRASGDHAQALRAFLGETTRLSAATLVVERVSVWRIDDEGRELRCLDLYELSRDAHSEGTVLRSADYPRYFAALEIGRAIDADDARTDPRTNEFRDGYLVPLGITSMLDAAIRRAGRAIGVVCHEHVGLPRAWTADEVEFAGAFADQVALGLADAERRGLEADRERIHDDLERARVEAKIDELTRLGNRRELEQMLGREVARALRYGRPLAVAMLDIDHFKTINDEFGHPTGDEVLRQVADVLCAGLRAADTATRYGGEEFVLLLPETPGSAAVPLLERLRESVQAHAFALSATGRHVSARLTVSIGVAALPDDADSPAALLLAADRAMYRAKTLGRNRVVRASDGAVESSGSASASGP